jgi:hypothetical protein
VARQAIAVDRHVSKISLQLRSVHADLQITHVAKSERGRSFHTVIVEHQIFDSSERDVFFLLAARPVAEVERIIRSVRRHGSASRH